ncbi:hypothetical protein L1887_27407 [Cichorium endivia]|nr:hypothetical protein L1887_27407 [Cichorium endivia]
MAADFEIGESSFRDVAFVSRTADTARSSVVAVSVVEESLPVYHDHGDCNDKPFGEISAYLYTIEFQKRGLPHCHTLW